MTRRTDVVKHVKEKKIKIMQSFTIVVKFSSVEPSTKQIQHVNLAFPSEFVFLSFFTLPYNFYDRIDYKVIIFSFPRSA